MPSTSTPTGRRPSRSGSGAPMGTIFGLNGRAVAVYTRPSAVTCGAGKFAGGDRLLVQRALRRR